jgi:predicted secreted protein
MRSVDEQGDEHIEVTPQEASGGRKGTHLLIMLAVSTLAAAIIMGAFWALTSVG